MKNEEQLIDDIIEIINELDEYKKELERKLFNIRSAIIQKEYCPKK